LLLPLLNKQLHELIALGRELGRSRSLKLHRAELDRALAADAAILVGEQSRLKTLTVRAENFLRADRIKFPTIVSRSASPALRSHDDLLRLSHAGSMRS